MKALADTPLALPAAIGWPVVAARPPAARESHPTLLQRLARFFVAMPAPRQLPYY
jgi:hypothetical protein